MGNHTLNTTIDKLSNEITDMILNGAGEEELKSAVNYSMEAIDAAKRVED